MDPALNNLSWMITLPALAGLTAVMLTRFGWPWLRYAMAREEAFYERVLTHQLLLDIPPRVALLGSVGLVLSAGVMAALVLESVFALMVGVLAGLTLPNAVVRYLAARRAQRLESQLVDGITTLASGVRAGLTLVQAIELLVSNHTGPIQQEFAQLLREYQMGLDLNQAMRNTANRVGLSNYRLLFTAIEMHRLRGGNTGESLDRICDSIREIQRLEGKLDAITAQGRLQATFIAVGTLGLLLMFYLIDPDNMRILFVEPLGRVVLLIAGLIMLGAFRWIKKIMAVDI